MFTILIHVFGISTWRLVFRSGGQCSMKSFNFFFWGGGLINIVKMVKWTPKSKKLVYHLENVLSDTDDS